MLRVLSWNVNGIRACAGKGFPAWLAAESPDILCLQETKAHPEQLPKELLAPSDGRGGTYHAFWASAKRRGYSGTAILSRREPRSISFLGVPEFDDEGRTLLADFGSLVVVSAYFPNSQDAGARLDYKLRYCEAMLSALGHLVDAGRNVLLCGDYNIAHEPIDLAFPRQNEGNAGYLPEERAWMTRFLGRGYVDSLRRARPGEAGLYTWWTYRVPGARERNVGWRLDYHCVNESLAPAVRAATIHPEVTGSDHCPVGLELDLEE